ncbi:MAG TPA: hypothetical protein VGC08_12570 [Pedobacter sp.]|jgi:hypothetical protein
MKTQVLKIGSAASFLIFLFILCGSVTSANAQNEPAAGMQITRTEVIRLVKEIDSSMVFRQTSDLDDLTAFVGKNRHKAVVQLLGDEEELKSVRWIFSFEADAEINKEYVLNMSSFMFSMGDEKGGDWLNEQMSAIAAQTNKEFISKSKQLDHHRKAQLIYNPKGKTMNLLFTEW